MAHGTVLVIEDDEWVAQLLAAAIRDAGYDVTLAHNAKGGLEKAIQTEPDCIVCDADLPDESGHYVVRTVRTQPTRVSVTPFVFLSEHDDEASRLEGFQVGADVYMTKPFRVDEVVAQVGALVHMAARLRRRRDTLLSIPPGSELGMRAFEGDLGQMSIATVLTVLELERRSGTFEVVSKKRRASIEVVSGCIVGATIGGSAIPPLDALRTLLGWNVGRFAFTLALLERHPPSGMPTIGNLLLEAARLEDESALPNSLRGRANPASSGRAPGATAPILGGKIASEDDLAPPSSRGLLLAKRASVPPPAPQRALRPPAGATPAPRSITQPSFPIPAAPKKTPAPLPAPLIPAPPRTETSAVQAAKPPSVPAKPPTATPAPPAAPARPEPNPPASLQLDEAWDEPGPLSQRGAAPKANPTPASAKPPPRPPARPPPRPPPRAGIQDPKK